MWGITREELDAFGAASQQKTEAAQKAGRFEDEIVPVMVKKKKEMVEFKVDEFPKAGVTKESVAKLRGAFPVGPEGVEDTIEHTFQPTQIHEPMPTSTSSASPPPTPPASTTPLRL